MATSDPLDVVIRPAGVAMLRARLEPHAWPQTGDRGVTSAEWWRRFCVAQGLAGGDEPGERAGGVEEERFA
jgi:hypothetical protein